MDQALPLIFSLGCASMSLLLVTLFIKDTVESSAELRKLERPTSCDAPLTPQPNSRLGLPSWCKTMADSVSLATCTEVDFEKQQLNASPAYIALMFLLMFTCTLTVSSMIIPYMKSAKFGLTDLQIGFLNAGRFACSWASLFGIPILLRRTCSMNTELLLIRIGSGIAMVGIAGYIVVPSAALL